MPSLSTLAPAFRPYATELLRYAKALDARFIVTSARRSRTEQQRLYNRYLKGESPFPANPPGRSMHELGLAVDLARFGVDPSDDELLAELGAEWKAAGGTWGGASDPVHFGAPASWRG